MIVRLSHNDKETAKRILEIQIPAYRVEAEMIGFHDIPQLNDTVKSIMGSGETFLGYMDGPNLLGVLSFVDRNNDIEICRLVVHPTFFRKGIARKLLAYILSKSETEKRITVSTGDRNEPAMNLYQCSGFSKFAETEINDGVYLAHLERKGNEGGGGRLA
ncbi:GNAT family N-acetyltransferase [Oceanobacillus bengalensis]|uniref:GNAT family N-acetyltransferase n=1 Tax=Oceanobacillus bengalensis TaxID=1435466 RepID=A0A494Z2R8_9BACI|nr:GNAT family N-acetyltransferase [Oceanobacillus bengalensis]RKQ16808.1 GNAT family N-acetyltransferase [Oceanobacillus bengalensis]